MRKLSLALVLAMLLGMLAVLPASAEAPAYKQSPMLADFYGIFGDFSV